MRIGQYLTKIWTKLCGLLFWANPYFLTPPTFKLISDYDAFIHCIMDRLQIPATIIFSPNLHVLTNCSRPVSLYTCWRHLWQQCPMRWLADTRSQPRSHCRRMRKLHHRCHGYCRTQWPAAYLSMMQLVSC